MTTPAPRPPHTSYTPLVVTAELSAPVILDRWQPLDGILGAAILEDPDLSYQHRGVTRWQRNVARFGLADATAYWQRQGWEIPQERHFIPLAVWGHGVQSNLWTYAASWAQPGDDYEIDTTAFTKRLDFNQAHDWVQPPKKTQRIQIGKGEFKPLYLEFTLTVTDSLTWRICGEPERLQEILGVVRSIGKKRRRGYGNVRRWRIEPDAADHSVFTPAGLLMRPVPIRLLDLLHVSGAFEQAHTAYRPPYHDGRYVALCAVSGQRSL